MDELGMIREPPALVQKKHRASGRELCRFYQRYLSAKESRTELCNEISTWDKAGDYIPEEVRFYNPLSTCVPQGTLTGLWVIDQAFKIIFASNIPSVVDTELLACTTMDLTRGSADQSLPKEVPVVKIPYRKNNIDLASDIEDILGIIGKGHTLLYRGMGSKASEALLERFGSSWNPAQAAEFGQGLYVTPNLDYAVTYAAGATGAVWVFNQPDTAELEVWNPVGEKWRQLLVWANEIVCHEYPGMIAPVEHKGSDIIVGPISAETDDRRRRGLIPIPSENLVQCLYRTDRAQKLLAPCLLAIVYIDNTLPKRKSSRRVYQPGSGGSSVGGGTVQHDQGQEQSAEFVVEEKGVEDDKAREPPNNVEE